MCGSLPRALVSVLVHTAWDNALTPSEIAKPSPVSSQPANQKAALVEEVAVSRTRKEARDSWKSVYPLCQSTLRTKGGLLERF